jgi:shikimate kinase
VAGAKTVWLVGMMGAGKSTVGPALARRLGVRFVDTDAEIEREAGLAVSEIFARDGEDAFRAREREAIEALAGRPAVVALGGGAIARAGMPERLAATGTVVYLRAEPATLARRLGDARERPLLADLDPEGRRQRVEQLLATREAAYRSAALTVDTDERSAQEVVEAILAGLSGARDGATP